MEAEEFEISILGPVSTASPSENDQTTVNHMGAEAKKPRSRGHCCLKYVRFLFLLLFLAGLCSAGGYFIWYWKKRHPVVEGEVNNYDDVDYYDVVPSGSQPTVPTDDCPWNAERLPSDLQPYGYKLSLKLNLRRKQFSGSVDIRMRCKEATELIILHASLINCSGAKVEVSDLTTSENIAISEPTEYYEKNKVYVIRLIQKLTPGRIYKVSILGYTGRVSPEAPGMYKRTFRHGVRRRTFGQMLVSSLKPMGARYVFPCMDDPAMKATFDVTIEHPKGQTALSNMPSKTKTVLTDGWVREEFYRTPKMSTHLLGIALFDGLTSLEAVISRGRVVRVWAPFDPEENPSVEVALNTTIDAIHNIEQLVPVEYQLTKTDVIPVPGLSVPSSDYCGLLMIRETALFCDGQESSMSNQLKCELAISKAVAHNWFGNSVTVEWWDDLWLTEALSTMLAYESVAYQRPDVNICDLQWDDMIQPAMAADIFSRVDLSSYGHAVAIREDPAVEGKGIGLLRMLDTIISDKEFLKAIENVLARFSQDNMNRSQFWDAVSEATGFRIDVAAFMEPWVTQLGYPYVALGRHEERDESRNMFFVQEPFYYSGYVDFMRHLHPNTWEIPVTWKSESHTDTKLLTMTEEKYVVPDVTSPEEWVLGNSDSRGFYRVDYDNKNWALLADYLLYNHTLLEPSVRAVLIDDAFNNVRGSISLIPTAMEMTRYLDKEENYVPWKAALDAFHYVKTVVHGSCPTSSQCPYHCRLQEYIARKAARVLKRHSLQEPSPEKRLLVAVTFKAACQNGNKNVTKRAKIMFDRWKRKRIRIPPDIQESVIHVGIAAGDQNVWWHVWKQSNSSAISAQERQIFLCGLAASQQEWVLWRYLHFIFEEKGITVQEASLIFKCVTQTKVGRETAWKFVQGNWEKLTSKYADVPTLLEAIIQSTLTGLSTDQHFDQLEHFSSSVQEKYLRDLLEEAVHATRLNQRYIDRNLPYLEDWLKLPCARADTRDTKR
ncbi:aminopeptidase N-like isoform X1 [Branchiostoma floridae x Branchiostoma belcheri]